MKKFEKRMILNYVLAVVVAGIISGITAVIPMYMAVPKIIYANSVPTFLVGMTIGPVGGAIYAILISLVLNNIGMGSGTIIYVLLFQIFEVIIIALIWHEKKWNLIRYSLTVIGATFLLKPFSYLLYYIFNKNLLGERNCISYIKDMYGYYLQNSWRDTILLYATEVLAAYVIMRGIDILTKKRKGEEKKV